MVFWSVRQIKSLIQSDCQSLSQSIYEATSLLVDGHQTSKSVSQWSQVDHQKETVVVHWWGLVNTKILYQTSL